VAASTSSRSRPRFDHDQGFRKQLDQRVKGYFERTGRSVRGDWRMHLKTAALFGWFLASYAFLLLVATTWWHGVLGATSLAFAVAGLGFSVQHDANHGAYSHSGAVNGLLERTLDLLGASSYLWRWKHNVFHHTYTNISGADNDIALLPFARLSSSEPRHGMHRFQHARRDAPCPRQGRSERRDEEVRPARRGAVRPCNRSWRTRKPHQCFRLPNNSRRASERCDNAAGRLFQHPASRPLLAIYRMDHAMQVPQPQIRQGLRILAHGTIFPPTDLFPVLHNWGQTPQ
jgi:hypothetical protein